MNSSLEFISSQILSARTLFILICLSFLGYQTWLIFWQYSQQNYVTNIQFIKNHIGSLPAITICYDRFLSFDNLFQRFPDKDFVLELRENYTKLMSQLDGMNIMQINKETWAQLEAFDNHHNRIQDMMMNEMQSPYINSKLSSYQDFFVNITIRGTYMVNNHTQYYYKPHLTGHILNFWHEKFGLMYLLNNAMDIAPIESIYFLGDFQRKCFTFFSGLEQRFRRMKANLKKVILMIPFPREWFPYRARYEIYLSVHSPNIIPNANTFTTIDIMGEHTVIYSKVENQENSGVSTCVDYDLSYKHGNFNMKSDCLIQCLRNKLGSNCDLNIMEKLPQVPLRQILFPDLIPTEQCQFDNDKYNLMEEECSKICLDECHQEYYFQEIKLLRRSSLNNPMNMRVMELNFEPSSLPTIIVTHLPEMTFMTLFCNFGGLLGIWLGVSMLATMNNAWKLLKHVLAKLKRVNNINNNTLFIENNYYNNNSNHESHRHLISRRRFTKLNSPGRFHY